MKPQGHLPDDIIHYNILTRLPAVSLLRFKCVSKNWYALTKSSSFTSIHQKNLRISHDSSEFVILWGKNTEISKKYFKNYSFTYLDGTDSMHGRHREIETIDDCIEIIVGSSNGLICLRSNNFELALCNPLTREYRRLTVSRNFTLPLAKNTRCRFGFGFGYDQISCYYKIVKFTFLRNFNYNPIECIAEVYRTSTNSWKATEKPHPSTKIHYRTHGVLVNNVLHWICFMNGCAGRTILTFDLHTEKFGEMPYVNDKLKTSDEFLSLMVSSGRLYTIGRNYELNTNSIWVMKEYGKVESWTKLYELGELWVSQIITYRPRSEGDEVLVLLKHVDKETDKLLVWYNLEDKSIRKVNLRGKIIHGVPECVCMGSLALIPDNQPK